MNLRVACSALAICLIAAGSWRAQQSVKTTNKGQVVWEDAGQHQPENLAAVRIELKDQNCTDGKR